MEIRKLEPQEHGKTRALYEEVFSEDSRSFVDYYYTEKTRDNQIYVVEEAGEIQAMLHLNPYTLMVNGSRKAAHYIVAVATRKEYRGRGYMAALLKQALTDMYQAGESFTFLMPAAEAIYLPHDFRTVYEQQRKFCSEEEYRQAPGPASEDPGILVSKAKEEESEELAEAANGWLGEHFQVYALRDAAYYRRLQKEYASDGGCLMIERENGVITGCRTYMPGETGEENGIASWAGPSAGPLHRGTARPAATARRLPAPIQAAHRAWKNRFLLSIYVFPYRLFVFDGSRAAAGNPIKNYIIE